MRSLILLLLPFLFLSCSPRIPSKTGENRSDQAVESADLSAPALTMTRKDVPPQDETDKEGEKEIHEGWDEFSGPLFLQRIKPNAYVLTDSLIVGKQADPLSPQLSEREADYLVREFLTGYRAGTLRRELFTENVHPLFLEELEEYKHTGAEIREFYLGTFLQTGDRSMVRVALLTETGYLRGVIHMREVNGLWGIQDWEMPMANWPGDPLPVEGDELILPGIL